MITISQPAMGLNASGVNIARYQMANTWDIAPGAFTPQHLFDWTAHVAREAGKLKNIVIQCHGAPGLIMIGHALNRGNVVLFERWRGLVDKIWICACQPAYIDPTCAPNAFCSGDGNLFISEIARAAQCFVVAPTETQWNIAKTYPFGQIPTYEGLVLSYGPGGDVTWSHRYPSNWEGNRE